MNNATTAEYRKAARDAERALNWTRAAYCWACAIEAYPAARGELAKRDLSKMATRRDAARRAAEAAAERTLDDFNYVGSRHHY